jgi:peptidoglycan hydrolase CwlO-like protein
VTGAAMNLGDIGTVSVIAASAVGVLAFVFAVASLVGGNFRVARNAKIVADYEAGYKGLETRAKGQEQQIEELQRENATKETRITELQHEVHELQGKLSVLQEVVTSKSAIEQLASQLAAVTMASEQRQNMILNRVGETLSLVGELRTEVRAAHGDILGAVHDGK